ncbi:hypothetical protein LCGC14_1863250, partial [marine sediment metagenome]
TDLKKHNEALTTRNAELEQVAKGSEREQNAAEVAKEFSVDPAKLLQHVPDGDITKMRNLASDLPQTGNGNNASRPDSGKTGGEQGLGSMSPKERVEAGDRLLRTK